ncbi:MAG: response regulator [Myxococcales bacterium]
MSFNVLLVDDSKVVRTAVRKAIHMAGLPIGSVFEAGNGKEALELLRGQWIDLVFSDLSMPEMGGRDLVALMAHDGLLKSVPVVVVSSEQSQSLAQELQSLGVRGYIRKPFRPEDFRKVVVALFGPEKRA